MTTEHAVKKDTLNVTVVYAAAPRPFQDHDASRDETLSSLKGRAMTAFGLTEGGQPDGTQVQYKLYHGKEELTDLSQTLGSVAGPANAVQFKLAQVVTQGVA